MAKPDMSRGRDRKIESAAEARKKVEQNEQVNVRISPEARKALRAAAYVTGESLGALVEEALRSHYPKYFDLKSLPLEGDEV